MDKKAGKRSDVKQEFHKHRFADALVCLLLVLCVAMTPAPLRAEEYAPPSIANILKTLVRFGALDVSDDEVLNTYAMAVECKIYTRYYKDDFQWHKVQAAMRKAIRQDIMTYPTALYYDASLALTRYNFKDKVYLFSDRYSLKNVDFFSLSAEGDNSCDKNQNKLLPVDYHFVLDQPLALTGLPLSEEDANTLFDRMEKADNKKHVVFARVNMKVVFVDRLIYTRNQLTRRILGFLHQNTGRNYVRLDVRIGSIDFYEDEARTKLIYSYRP
jgi:hypothetical protein